MEMSTDPANPSASQAAPDLEQLAEQTIARLGGARAAIMELLIAKRLLEHELEMAKATNSFGYTRGWHHRRSEPPS